MLSFRFGLFEAGTSFCLCRRNAVIALLVATIMVWGCAAHAAGPDVYKPFFRTNFASGATGLMVHALPEDVSFVPAPGKSKLTAVKFEMNRYQDFSSVCNGTPRAEFCLLPLGKFQQGKEYKITWSSFIPADYQFDFAQPEIIMNIHQTLNTGSPPYCMTLMGNLYQVRLQNDQVNVVYITVGDASADKGKWINWRLQYKPDSTGKSSITRLYKESQLVFDGKGMPNSYPNDNGAYMKLGLYKWWWKVRASDVSRRAMLYGDVTAFVKIDPMPSKNVTK